MPLTKHGSEVRSSMRRQYGAKKGDSVFYALANSRRSGGKGKIGGKNIDRTRARRKR